MKKLVLSVLGMAACLLATAPAFAESTYECWRYLNGHPTGAGYINVRANSKSEAETKALQRFRELGGQMDSVRCHL